jgi:ATP-dependent DNA ligase
VLDGEIVALDAEGRPSFQTLRHRGTSPLHRIVFYAFDVLHVDGRDITGESLERRRARLPAIVGQDSICASHEYYQLPPRPSSKSCALLASRHDREAQGFDLRTG